MKAITTWQHLEEFGIVILTGEACNLGFRLLCDLTEQGAHLIRELYGLPFNTQFADSWNGGTEQDPHVGSVMLPYSAWKDIAILALWQRYPLVILTNSGVYAPEADEVFTRAEYTWNKQTDSAEQTRKATLTCDGNAMSFEPYFGAVERVFQKNDHPHVGSRNEHAMSGRVI